MEQKKKTLKERFFERATQLHRAWSTSECYWSWVVKFIRWHWQRAGGREIDWRLEKGINRVRLFSLSHGDWRPFDSQHSLRR